MILAILAMLAGAFTTALLVHAFLPRLSSRYRGGKQLCESIKARYPSLESNKVLNGKSAHLLYPCLQWIDERERVSDARVCSWLSAVNDELAKAGIQELWEPKLALAYKLSRALGAALIGTALVLLLLATGATLLILLFLWFVFAGVGKILFDHTFSDIIAERGRVVDRQLPYVLEFLSMSMRSNATFEAAIEEFCRVTDRSAPLHLEFRLVQRDIRYGLGTEEAFENLSRRLNMRSINVFTATVEQGLARGLSIKDVLIEQAKAVRLARYQSAERLAKEAAVKGLLPVMLSAASCVIALLAPLILTANWGGG